MYLEDSIEHIVNIVNGNNLKNTNAMRDYLPFSINVFNNMIEFDHNIIYIYIYIYI